MNTKRTPPATRFWSKVDQAGPGGCWLWTGCTTRLGYGQFKSGGRYGPVVYAHRWSYEVTYGPIPRGREIDHLCRIARCVNPEHLEAVAHRTNLLRGISPTILLYHASVCARGHAMTAENTYPRKNGRKQCRACRAINMRDFYRRHTLTPVVD